MPVSIIMIPFYHVCFLVYMKIINSNALMCDDMRIFAIQGIKIHFIINMLLCKSYYVKSVELVDIWVYRDLLSILTSCIDFREAPKGGCST